MYQQQQELPTVSFCVMAEGNLKKMPSRQACQSVRRLVTGSLALCRHRWESSYSVSHIQSLDSLKFLSCKKVSYHTVRSKLDLEEARLLSRCWCWLVGGGWWQGGRFV